MSEPMSQSPKPSAPSTPVSGDGASPAEVENPSTPSLEARPSYVKLAMRNMVRKRGKALYHFVLTTAGLLAVLVGLAYLTR